MPERRARVFRGSVLRQGHGDALITVRHAAQFFRPDNTLAPSYDLQTRGRMNGMNTRVPVCATT